jgi:hypothetical protein
MASLQSLVVTAYALNPIVESHLRRRLRYMKRLGESQVLVVLYYFGRVWSSFFLMPGDGTSRMRRCKGGTSQSEAMCHVVITGQGHTESVEHDDAPQY